RMKAETMKTGCGRQRRRGQDSRQSHGRQLTSQVAKPGDLPDVQRQLGHEDVVEEEGDEDTNRYTRHPSTLTHERAEKYQRGKHPLAPRPAIDSSRRARQRVAEAKARPEHHPQRQNLKRWDESGPLATKGDRDKIRSENRRYYAGRQSHQNHDGGSLQESARETALIVLDPRHRGKQHFVENISEKGGRNRHELEGSAIQTERHGSEP